MTAGGHPAVVDLPAVHGPWERITDLSGTSAPVPDERARARALAARLGGEKPPEVTLSGAEADVQEALTPEGGVGPVERARAQALAERLL